MSNLNYAPLNLPSIKLLLALLSLENQLNHRSSKRCSMKDFMKIHRKPPINWRKLKWNKTNRKLVNSVSRRSGLFRKRLRKGMVLISESLLRKELKDFTILGLNVMKKWLRNAENKKTNRMSRLTKAKKFSLKIYARTPKRSNLLMLNILTVYMKIHRKKKYACGNYKKKFTKIVGTVSHQISCLITSRLLSKWRQIRQ